MDYYRILDDIHFPTRWQLDAPEANGTDVDPSDFTSCRPFTHSVELFSNSSLGVPLDFTLAELDVPIVSDRISKIILRFACEDVQLIPVSVGNVKEQYYILNAIRRIDCFDERRSVYTKWSAEDGRLDKIGTYRMVAKLRVDVSRISGVNVCRIHNWDVPLIVSEKIKIELEKYRFNGIIFKLVS